ncbi:unnamed protein product [Phaedon cochleariae]|uniref:Tudor domain-containing protein n=1 Tax=Phaedon cochleariae TaxID=80249 RepID=A0A9P0DHI4_PHACE|nr:unnamed protein product [Phaedon cochleariae]
MDRTIKFCHITGVTGSVNTADRPLIRKEFEQFGKTRKIYIADTFSKVYFENQGSCELAVQGLKYNDYGWIVELGEEQSYQKSGNQFSQANSTFKERREEEKTNMDDYLDEDFLENHEYCDIHGNLLTTVEGEYSNDLYIKLKDIRRAGFAVFRRDTFDRLIVNKNQLLKEFDLHLLSEAKNYLLKNKVGEIDEEQILRTIERCKTKLLGDQSTSSRSHNISMGRQVTNTDNNLTISKNVPKGGYESFDSSENVAPQRPPKTLPNNFVPSHRNNSQRSFQGPRDNDRETNGFGGNRDHHPNQNRPHNANYRSKSRTRDEAAQYSDNSDRQRGNAGFRNGNRTRDEGTQFSDGSNHSGRGFNSRDRNAHLGSNSDMSQRSMSREGGSHFGQNADNKRKDSHHSRDNLNRPEKSSEPAERKQRMEFEVDEQLKRIDLQVGDYHDVTVCYLERDHGKNNICWVHKQDVTSDLEDVILKLLDAGPKCDLVTDPMTGQLCVALFEDAWYRCKLMRKDPLHVQFLDYGNKSIVDSVRVLPEEFREIPSLALRLVCNGGPVLEDEMDLRVRIKNKYDDGTYLVDSEAQSLRPCRQQHQQTKAAEAPTEAPKEAKKEIPKEEPKVERKEEAIEKPAKKIEEKKVTEKAYFDVPKPLATLKNGDVIMVCGIIDNKFAVKTRECATKTLEVVNYIKSLDKSSLLLSDVKKGRMVLCSIDGLPNLHRAIVTDEPRDGVVSVRYLDYMGENQMTVKSLRNVDDFLASHPLCMLTTPECQLLEDLSPKAAECIAQLVEKKTKVKMVLTEDDDFFDIQMDDGSLLLQTISNLGSKPEKAEQPASDIRLVPVKQPNRASEPAAAPAKAEPAKAPAKVESVSAPAKTPVKEVVDESPVMYDHMDWIKAEVGATEDFMCYTIKDVENVTLISLTDESLKYLEAVTDLVVEDDAAYEPGMFEMCMVAYKGPDDEEAAWYRGAVLEKDEDQITVNSVDYGTNIVVTKKDIRKFNKKYKDVPILGITCEFVNIPDNEKVLEKLKELIPEGDQVKVVLKDFDGLKYQIEVPEVYSALKKQGLI